MKLKIKILLGSSIAFLLFCFGASATDFIPNRDKEDLLALKGEITGAEIDKMMARWDLMNRRPKLIGKNAEYSICILELKEDPAKTLIDAASVSETKRVAREFCWYFLYSDAPRTLLEKMNPFRESFFCKIEQSQLPDPNKPIDPYQYQNVGSVRLRCEILDNPIEARREHAALREQWRRLRIETLERQIREQAAVDARSEPQRKK